LISDIAILHFAKKRNVPEGKAAKIREGRTIVTWSAARVSASRLWGASGQGLRPQAGGFLNAEIPFQAPAARRAVLASHIHSIYRRPANP
jgi:hypothetical protein